MTSQNLSGTTIVYRAVYLGGWGYSKYKLYGYMPPQRVWCLSHFGLKMGIGFEHFGLKRRKFFINCFIMD